MSFWMWIVYIYLLHAIDLAYYKKIIEKESKFLIRHCADLLRHGMFQLGNAYFPKGMLSFLGKAFSWVQMFQGFQFSCDTCTN